MNNLLKSQKKAAALLKDITFACVVQPFHPNQIGGVTWRTKLTRYVALGYLKIMGKPSFENQKFLDRMREVYSEVYEANRRKDTTALYHLTTKFGFSESKKLKRETTVSITDSSIYHAVVRMISEAGKSVAQVTVKFVINGREEYVVFEKDVKDPVCVWKYVSTLDTTKEYPIPTSSEYIKLGL